VKLAIVGEPRDNLLHVDIPYPNTHKLRAVQTSLLFLSLADGRLAEVFLPAIQGAGRNSYSASNSLFTTDLERS